MHGRGEIVIRLSRKSAEDIAYDRDVSDSACNATRAALGLVDPGVIESATFIPIEGGLRHLARVLNNLVERTAAISTVHDQAGAHEQALAARDLLSNLLPTDPTSQSNNPASPAGSDRETEES